MTKQVQRRRGTDTQHTSFTGAEGEISVNTTNKSIHVHDGATAGGVEAARADLGNVSDADLNSALSGNTLSSLTVTSADINGGTIDGTVIGGTTPAAGSFTTGSFTGDVSFGDNNKAIFGAGSDLQIYHDGANSLIKDSGTGHIKILANDFRLQNVTESQAMIAADQGGAVTLYNNGSPKLATTSTGIDVTGTVTADGLTVDAPTGNPTLTIQGNDASYTSILNINGGGGGGGVINSDGATSDNLRIQVNSTDVAFFQSGGDISFYEDTGTTPKFFWDASAEQLIVGGSTAAGDAAADDLLIGQGSGNQGLSIYSGASSTGNLFFKDSSSNFAGYVQYDHSDNSMRLGTSTSPRMTIDSSGNVGIGTSPDSNSKLHILDATASADDYTVHIEGYTPAVVWQDISGGPSTDFAVQVDASAMMFRYGDASTGTQLASEAMRIDASGNLLVGKTSGPNYNVVGVDLTALGEGQFTVDSNPVLQLNRQTSDGDIAVFRKDGAPVGSIGSRAGTVIYITSNGTNETGLDFGGTSVNPMLSGSLSNGTTDLGNAGNRFKDLYLSGGVYLGGTGSANKLDDYEEGTWTPSFTGLTIGNGTVSGTYTKIGRQVTVVFGFDCGSTTSVGTLGDITGLPFASSNDYIGFIKVHGVAFDSGSRWYEAVAVLGNNSSGILVPSISNYNSSISSTNPMPWTTNDTLVFTATYTTT